MTARARERQRLLEDLLDYLSDDTPPTARKPCGAVANISQHDCELLMCCYNATGVGDGMNAAGARAAAPPACFQSPISDQQLYERNARTLVTLWGPHNSGLHEYSYRLWAGLVGNFYAPRWQKWFADVRAAMVAGISFDQNAYDATIQDWEEAWTRRSDNYTVEPAGDAVAISAKLLQQLF